jgi:DNA-directed RNA polymerase specialized sigma24 family protein
MIEMAQASAVKITQHGRLSRKLVDRVAAGDRAAFRCLCTMMSTGVWRAAVLALPRPLDARAVTRATFLEVWHLARHHVNDPPADASVWITAIAMRRIGERLRTLGTPHTLLDDYDRHVHCELAELLAPEPSSTSIPRRRRGRRPRVRGAR